MLLRRQEDKKDTASIFFGLNKGVSLLDDVLKQYSEADGDEDDTNTYNDNIDTTDTPPDTNNNDTTAETNTDTDNNEERPYNDTVDTDDEDTNQQEPETDTTDDNTDTPETTDTDSDQPYNDTVNTSDNAEPAQDTTTNNTGQQTNNDNNEDELKPANFEELRKYKLYKQYDILYNKIIVYEKSLQSIDSADEHIDYIIQYALNKFSNIKNMMYEYMTLVFKTRSFEESRLTYQRFITSIELVLSILGDINNSDSK